MNRRFCVLLFCLFIFNTQYAFAWNATGWANVGKGMEEARRDRENLRAQELANEEAEERLRQNRLANTDPRLRALTRSGAISAQSQQLIFSNLVSALEMDSAGTSRAWRNEQLGSSGTVTVGSIIQSQFGDSCREFRLTLTDANGEAKALQANACRKNGQWQWMQ